jgi:flagellar motor switch protein FliM
VDVAPGPFEPVPAADFLFSLVSPCAAFVFVAGETRGVVDLGLPVSHYLIERLFGGDGESQAPDRPLTPLEQVTVRGTAERIVQLLRETWKAPGIRPEVIGFESDPAALPLRNGEEVVIVSTFAIKAPGFEGRFTVALPLAALEPLFGESPARAVAPVMPSSATGQELQRVHLALTARLPLFRLSAREAGSLAIGQTLATGHGADTPVEVLVNGRVRFRGAMGQRRGRLGLRITEVVAGSRDARPPRDTEGRAL